MWNDVDKTSYGLSGLLFTSRHPYRSQILFSLRSGLPPSSVQRKKNSKTTIRHTIDHRNNKQQPKQYHS